jgi:hypothetical protein
MTNQATHGGKPFPLVVRTVIEVCAYYRHWISAIVIDVSAATEKALPAFSRPSA